MIEFNRGKICIKILMRPHSSVLLVGARDKIETGFDVGAYQLFIAADRIELQKMLASLIGSNK